jgi:chromosome partitioning protein
MDIYKLAEAASKLHLSPNALKSLLAHRTIPSIIRSTYTPRDTRTSYYIPEVFIDYAQHALELDERFAFTRLSTEKNYLEAYANKNGTQVISFSNLKGGVGKTSIAANFAYTLALLNKRVLLVDMDSQANSSRYFANRYFSGNSIKNIFDAVIHKEKVDAEFIGNYIKTIRFENAALDLLPSELALGRVVEFSRAVFTMPHKKLSDILKPIKENYDFIIIDTPPTTGLSLHMSIYASDKVSIVTDAEDFSVNGLNELATEIQEIEDETEHVVTVDSFFINKVKKSNIHQVYIEAIAALAIDQQIEHVYTISDSIRFKEAQNLHIPLIEYKNELEKKLVLSESLIDYAIERATGA